MELLEWSQSLFQNHIQQECCESARERRIALYKRDQQQQLKSVKGNLNIKAKAGKQG